MKYFFLTVLVIVMSCTPDERPPNLIERDKMASLLVKIHVLEAKIKDASITPKDSIQLIYDHYEKLLFEDFDVTQEQYEISFDYYAGHPDEFEKIYRSVVDSLLQKEKTGR